MARTAPDGTLALRDLASGAYLLMVGAEGYSAHVEEVVLSDGEQRVLEVRLTRLPSAVAGVVVHAATDAPVAGAVVVLGDRRTETDAQGRYQFADVEPGVHTLQVSADGFMAYEATITVRPGETEQIDAFLVPAKPTLLVRVVDAATGQPVEDAVISYRAGEDLPCADPKLLAPLKRSRLYGQIRPRVADLKPSDSWIQDDLHFLTFRLKPVNGTVLPEPPVAVFTMHPDSKEPLSGVILTPRPDGGEPEVVELRQPRPTNGHVNLNDPNSQRP